MLTRIRLVIPVVAVAIAAPAAASASPASLARGHWSLGHEVFSSVNLAVGYGIGDLTRIIVSGGVSKTGDRVDTSFTSADTTESRTEIGANYSIGVALQRYLGGMSTDRLAPFIGGGFLASGFGDQTLTFDSIEQKVEREANFAVDGRFGVEAFLVESLSVSGNVGVAVTSAGGLTQTQTPGTNRFVRDRQTTVNTLKTAVTVTFYLGG